MSYSNIEPIEDTSKNFIENLNSFALPDEKSPELVYIINVNEDRNGFCNVALINKCINNNPGLGIYLKFLKRDFPYFNLWKRLNKGESALGFEPGNCTVAGRIHQRNLGDLKYLKPRETVNYKMEIGVLRSDKEIEKYMH